MGVFDPENSSIIESTPEAGPATETKEPATQTDEGHVEPEAKETQAPETTETATKQTEETKTTEPESKATQKIEDHKTTNTTEPKLFAGRYKTVGGLVNGVSEAAKLLGETVDWNNINGPEEMEDLYLTYRQRIGKGEVKNAGREKEPEAIRKEINEQQSELDKELQKIIDASNATLKQLETETDPENDEEFEAMFAENPRKALADRDARIAGRLRKEFEAKLNLEGAKIAGMIGPYIEKAKANEMKEADTASWETSIGNMTKVIEEHGDNDFQEMLPEVIEYLKSNPEMYDVVNANPNAPGIREKVLSLAYRDIKLEKKLKELAKTTSEKDTKEIENSKGGLKVQSGVGGGANNTPKKENELDKIFGSKVESVGVFG